MWKEVTLESITSKIGDGLHGTPIYDENGDYYFINGNNLIDGRVVITPNTKTSSYTEYIKYKKDLNDRTIFISINGTLGNISFYNNEKVFLGKSVCYINIVKQVDKYFIRYVLESSLFQHYIEVYATGATIKNMGLKAMRNFTFTLPPLKNQQKIATLLSNYDKFIENNTQRIKVLESMAEELYKEWFVRLRFPGHEDVEVVDGVPEGWESTTIGEVCIVSGGGTPSTTKQEYWENGDVLWFSPTDLSKVNSLCIFESAKKTNSLGIKNSSAKILNSNSFMMTSRATIGLFALIRKDFSTNQGFINITPLKIEEKYYLFYNFKTRVNELKSIATGATFPELSKSQFKSLKILIPSNNFIKLFDDFVNPFIDEIFVLEEKQQTLKQTRDLLLPRLMSAKLNVEDLDII